MKLNLDTLKAEIDEHLKKAGLAVFYGLSRAMDNPLEVRWDTGNYPDYQPFVAVAKQLDVRMIVLHHRSFNASIIEHAIDELTSGEYEYEDQRQYESSLRELTMYDGFTCAVELSFDFDSTTYLFELRTDWYTELNDILDQLDFRSEDEDDDEDSTYGGYYSRN